MGTTGISGLATQLADYLPQLQEKQQGSLSSNDTAALSDTASTLLSTLKTDTVTLSDVGYAKSQNLVGINSVGESTASDMSYLDAYMAGASSRLTLQNSMSSSLESGMESTMDQVNKAAFWNNPGMRTALMLQTLGSSFQQIFDDLQAMVDEQIAKAQEAKTQTADSSEQGATDAAAGDAATAAAQTQAAAAQSVSADTGQTPDAVASAADAGATSGGEAQTTQAPASISLTV